jgi:hypothetical protein
MPYSIDGTSLHIPHVPTDKYVSANNYLEAGPITKTGTTFAALLSFNYTVKSASNYIWTFGLFSASLSNSGVGCAIDWKLRINSTDIHIGSIPSETNNIALSAGAIDLNQYAAGALIGALQWSVRGGGTAQIDNATRNREWARIIVVEFSV